MARVNESTAKEIWAELGAMRSAMSSTSSFPLMLVVDPEIVTSPSGAMTSTLDAYKAKFKLRRVRTFSADDRSVIDEIRNRHRQPIQSSLLVYNLVTQAFELYDVERRQGCFIATAAYGSALAPEVTLLRRFRDEVLLPSRIGPAAVRFYEAVSPPLASLISRTGVLRAVTRHVVLKPILKLLKTRAVLADRACDTRDGE